MTLGGSETVADPGSVMAGTQVSGAVTAEPQKRELGPVA